MKLDWQRIQLRLATPFRTAKALRTDKQTLWVRLDHEGVVGWGESVPMDTYRQTLESSEAALRAIRETLHGDPLDLEDTLSRLLREFDAERATVCAVDAALHDWIGKRHGIPTVRWLGLNPDHAPATSLSIGIAEPEEMAELALRAKTHPIFKIKLGSQRDEESLKALRRAAPEKTIRVDANGAWDVPTALERMAMLRDYAVEFVEQPVPAADLEGLRRLKESGLCPVVADESCVRQADVIALAGRVDGINIKLSKCGGIREAMKMIHLAKAHGMKVMLGCMIESSLGIAAAAQLAPLADWLDLDGHLLLSDEPFTGIGGHGGRLTIGEGPGLGVRLRG